MGIVHGFSMGFFGKFSMGFYGDPWDLSNMGIFSWDLPSGNLTLAMEHRLFLIGKSFTMITTGSLPVWVCLKLGDTHTLHIVF